MTKELTDRQKEVFEFVRGAMRQAMRPPTVREIADHFGFRSPKAATDHLTALERKGYIRRRGRKSRNIEIPEGLSPQGVPLVGRIAAGSPILAVENLEGSLSLPEVFGAKKDAFALRVHGDSMIGAGILEGDYVIVDNGGRVQSGAIAAVQVGDEATVKRVFFERGRVRLVGENPEFEDIVVDRKSPDLSVYGPVIGLVRRL